MRELEFNILREMEEREIKDIPETWKDIPGYQVAFDKLKRAGFVDDCGVSILGREALKPYKVDNAIIMAAGYSARCMPLSNVMPKGLFRIKGEILIEREIEQLLQAGITEIIVVTGFMSEKFQYLEQKYGVHLLNNPDYDKYNNMASLYTAREYMKNSYILCSDNYYKQNIFHQYHFTPYYSCIYSEDYCDEFCVTEIDQDGYIEAVHRGGSKSWYTIGDAFFDREFSKNSVILCLMNGKIWKYVICLWMIFT